MATASLLTIVLAAGKGTRMKSARAKVLHPIAGRSMLGHVLALTKAADGDRVAVVIGPDMDAVRQEVATHAPGAQVFLQENQLGTADAVRAARPAIAAHNGFVIVLFADTPLFRPETLDAVKATLARGAHIAVVGFEPNDPTNYGRLIRNADGRLTAIREHREASPEELKTRLCNAGVMGLRSEHLLALLDAIDNKNAKGEYYLTDAIALAHAKGLALDVIVCPEDEVLGVDSRDKLAAAEAIWQRRARFDAMQAGATLIAPETVWFSHDTRVGRDVTIEPNVFFGPGVTIGDEVQIKANCHIEGATIARGARIGPFARLRPGAALGPDVHVGNFVEVKNVTMASGAKANHLAYLGDGTVGAGANIGAGTIFCNYDGFNKHRTEIGDGAFVGSNSALVAPVKIGAGAYVGSGSVITKDVPADALALERSAQDTRPGWAAKFRILMARKKAAK